MRQIFQYDPVIGYRYIPGLKARISHEGGGYLFQVNSAGFRCRHDFTVRKKEGRSRILLFGDSFTAGDGVSDCKRFGDLLEEKIPDLEVYNFGLPGTGTDQQYLAYREYGAKLESDLLVIAVLVENIRRVAAHYRFFKNERGEELCYAKPYFELAGGEPVLRHVPVNPAPYMEADLPDEAKRYLDRGGRHYRLRKLINQMGLKDLLQRLTRYQPLPEYNHPENPAWLLMQAILKRWAADYAGEVLLVPLPLYQYIEETSDPAAYRARFQELAAGAGCRLHDPLPDLLKYPLPERRRFRFTGDVHLTPEGHRALALSLKKVISEMLTGGKAVSK